MDDSTERAAPLWRRMAAALYDLFPAFALWMAAGALWIGIAKMLSVAPTSGVENMGHWAAGNWAYFAYLMLVAFAYYGISWRYGAHTLGMRAWRLELRGENDVRPTWMQLVVRFVVAIIGTLAAGLGFWWSLIDSRRRTWHDIASRTRLMHVPKPRG
jgi:uncharacterized RDD family membrane protein YckC